MSWYREHCDEVDAWARYASKSYWIGFVLGVIAGILLGIIIGVTI